MMETTQVLSAAKTRASLRVAVNLGNIALARVDAATGKLEGVSIELAKALSDHTGLLLDFVSYPSAGKVVDAAGGDEWDIAFLAFDPSREDRLTFSPAYALLEATFIVRNTSAYRSVADLDNAGIKLSVTRNAAYALYLRENFKQAELVHAATPGEALECFGAADLDAAAGIRQALEEFSARNANFRVLPDSFLSIRQCIAIRNQSPDIRALVLDFSDRLKTRGFPKPMFDEARRSGVTLKVMDMS
jgi:polar amino acid transport system substrate-binding protein